VTHISRSLLRGSLDLDSTLPPLLHLQTHRRRFFPSKYVRQFSNRGWSCKPRAAASDTPSLSTPRDLRQHRDAQTAVHCISALVPTCPVAAGSPLAVGAPWPGLGPTTRLQDPSPFRKSSHIDFMLYQPPVKVSRRGSRVLHNRVLAVSSLMTRPSHHHHHSISGTRATSSSLFYMPGAGAYRGVTRSILRASLVVIALS
jgi:hypothetical protein